MNDFVIHEHKAQKAGLHHDFRLERDGVLKSWAVPKGVPEKPGVRRIAAPVEDHKLSYGNFEGRIPKGQYGAGTVKIWDSGKYETNSWSNIKIEVTLHGKRVEGRYILRWMEKIKNWLIWKQ